MTTKPYIVFDLRYFHCDTIFLSTEELGAYLQILCEYTIQGESLTEITLPKIVGCTPKKWAIYREPLARLFKIEKGLWTPAGRHIRKIKTLTPRKSRTPQLGRLPLNEWVELRLRVFIRDNWTCQYCGIRGGKLECDHIHPVSKGGSNDESNLATACKPCNRSKRAKTVEEWRSL